MVRASKKSFQLSSACANLETNNELSVCYVVTSEQFKSSTVYLPALSKCRRLILFSMEGLKMEVAKGLGKQMCNE